MDASDIVFESVDGQQKMLYYKPTLWAFGSGELEKKKPIPYNGICSHCQIFTICINK